MCFRGSSHLTESVCEGLCEPQGGTTVIAKCLACHLCRVRSEAIVVADVAPEASLEDLQSAILVSETDTAIDEPRRSLQACVHHLHCDDTDMLTRACGGGSGLYKHG